MKITIKITNITEIADRRIIQVLWDSELPSHKLQILQISQNYANERYRTLHCRNHRDCKYCSYGNKIHRAPIAEIADNYCKYYRIFATSLSECFIVNLISICNFWDTDLWYSQYLQIKGASFSLNFSTQHLRIYNICNSDKNSAIFAMLTIACISGHKCVFFFRKSTANFHEILK